jgi:hypothetical protein
LKYNIRSRNKGTLDFLGKVEGQLGHLEIEKKIPTQGNEVFYVSSQKTSFLEKSNVENNYP